MFGTSFLSSSMQNTSSENFTFLLRTTLSSENYSSLPHQSTLIPAANQLNIKSANTHARGRPSGCFATALMHANSSDYVAFFGG
jgi:hypothetical protein